MMTDDYKTRRQAIVAWARSAHADQKHGPRPYTAHLAEVEAVLHRFSYDPNAAGLDEAALTRAQTLSLAAWLHDIVEDTPVTLDEVRERAGQDVAALVGAVTNEEGPNRHARHLKTYPKIASTPNAVILKLADRIANVETCLCGGDSKSVRLFKMYQREFEGFRSALQRDAAAPMWKHLAQLMRKEPGGTPPQA